MSYTSDILQICEEYKCKTETDADMKKYTSFKTGGMCRLLISVNCIEILSKLMNYMKENRIKYTIIGKGSNVIVSDEGFNGVILMLNGDFADIKILSDGVIECDAGASLQSACRFALDNSLTGLEFAWGIPGTIGGAVFMNAGAYGGEIKDTISYADYLDTDGLIKRINKDDMELSYRHSFFTDHNGVVILKAGFILKKGEKSVIKAKMDELLQKRKDKQPLNYPSAGSTFKRPEGSYASYLIEKCGLKGLNVGGAEVSVKHSGFIINKGGATTSDILKLADVVRDTVKKETGYVLELEPRIIK